MQGIDDEVSLLRCVYVVSEMGCRMGNPHTLAQWRMHEASMFVFRSADIREAQRRSDVLAAWMSLGSSFDTFVYRQLVVQVLTDPSMWT